MILAPIPEDETPRLAALRALQILDTPPEERFDRITRMAQRIFNVPVSLISLIDANRQWFKSKQGLDVTESPRDVAFCGHVVAQPEMLVIEDASADARFWDNPFVTEAPHIRFYAGHPLPTEDGLNVGTLCLISPIPQKLTAEEREIFRDLAAMAADELRRMEASRLAQQLARSNLELDARVAELDMYAQTIAHDLKSPLAGIAGVSGLMAEALEGCPASLPGRESLVEMTAAIQETSVQCMGIVDNLLLFARLRRADEAPCVPLRMGEVVERALSRLQHQVSQAGAEIVQPTEWPVALGHAPWVEEVWANYLANALKYGRPAKGVPFRIELKARAGAEGGRHRFEVRDFGRGISPELQARLFRAGGNLEERPDSHGLGLSIVRRVCERLGGTAGVESEGTPGRGAVFYFELPAAAEKVEG